MVSFFGGKKNQTTTTTSGFNAPDWLKTYLDQNLKGGYANLEKQAASTADERIMGFTPDELAAQERVRSGVGQYDDIIGSALGTLQQAQRKSFEGVNPEDIQKFMNPYQQNVTDITKRESVRDADVARAKMGVNASPFGGSGGLLRAMELDRNLGQQLSDIQYKGSADAFTNALNAARQSTSDSIAAGNAIGGLATTGSNIYNRDTGALAASGESQRGLEQAKTDFTYTNPFQTAVQGQQLAQGAFPLYGSTGSSTTPVQQAGWGSKLLGMGLAGASLMSGNPMAAFSLAGATGGGGGGGGANPLTGDALTNASSGFMPTPQLTSSLGFMADGGPVKMKDGGEPISEKINQILNPESLNKVYTPNTDMAIPQSPSIRPNDVFTTTSPERNALEENISTERMQQIFGPFGSPSEMVTPKKESDTKSALQRMIDATNLPLLKMGLTMMGSDKPFAEAIAEGGLAGAEQIGAERKAAGETQALQAKNALEALVAANQTRDMESKIGAREAKTNLEAMMAPEKQAYLKAMAERTGQNNQQFKALDAELRSLDKEYGRFADTLATSFDAQAKIEARQKMSELESRITQLRERMGSISGTPALSDTLIRNSEDLPE